MQWKETTIGKHCTVTSSKRFHLSERSSEGIPFYCSKEIIQKVSGQEITECDFIRKELYEDIKKQFGVPQTGDLLITTRGTYGVPYIYRDTDSFYFADGNLTWLKDFDEELSPQYLYYWVKSYIGQKCFDAIAKGTAQKAVPISAIKQLEIMLPPISIQHKIADILSAYDDLLENNQKQIKLLEEAAQRLFKEWFVDLRFPGHEKTPIMDGVPEGWKNKTLPEVFSFVRGKSYTSKELSDTHGSIMINLKNIRPFGGYNRNAEKRFVGKYKKEQALKAGDVIMGVTDMTKERRLVGHVALVPDLQDEMTFSMDLIKLIPKCISRYFLYSTMFFGGFSSKISPLANGVNVLHLKPETMNHLKMLVPSGPVIKMYDDWFDPMYKKIEVLENQIANLQEARDRLLSKLMGGEMEV